MIGLQAADAAHDDEVADVFLDGVGDAAELGVEVRRAGDEFLRLGGDLRRWVGAVGLQGGDPLADGAPLVVLSFDGGIAPLDGHARGESGPFRTGRHVAQDEGGHVFDLPTPMVGSDLDGLDGLELCQASEWARPGGRSTSSAWKTTGMPSGIRQTVLLDVGLQQFFGFADDCGAHIGGGRMDDASSCRWRA